MTESPSERCIPTDVSLPSSTILIVEDVGALRELYAGTFEGRGHRVLTAESAEDALRLLRRQRVDAVITDYVLPHATGAALLHQAINEGLLDPETPALICTGYAYVEPPPGVRILHKPIDPEELVGKIERALLRALIKARGEAS